ncbi:MULTISPECIES: hypothetical protein [Burkholderia]|uniref:hypothetical protein n=1 Tax=Burkholderia TaxID=32008 RepID=UPI0010488434|nr:MULTISPECIES: hypothetical protein [Burkholderia]
MRQINGAHRTPPEAVDRCVIDARVYGAERRDSWTARRAHKAWNDDRPAPSSGCQPILHDASEIPTRRLHLPSLSLSQWP